MVDTPILQCCTYAHRITLIGHVNRGAPPQFGCSQVILYVARATTLTRHVPIKLQGGWEDNMRM